MKDRITALGTCRLNHNRSFIAQCLQIMGTVPLWESFSLLGVDSLLQVPGQRATAARVGEPQHGAITGFSRVKGVNRLGWVTKAS